MQRKILSLILIFFGFFFFSCFNVNAAQWLEYDTSNCYSQFDLIRSDSTSLEIVYSNDWAYRNYDLTSVKAIGINCSLSNNNVFQANHEYDIYIEINGSATNTTQGITYDILPYLSTVGRDFVLDTNMIFSSKNFEFTTTDNSTLSREDLTDSIFSMGYNDSSSTLVYYIHFTFVAPVDITSFNISLYPNYSLRNTSSQLIWTPSSVSNAFTNTLSIKRILFDYGEFQGYEHPEVCVGDQCTYSPYLGYSNSLIQDSIDTGGSSLRSIISNSWDNIQGFITSSYYILSLCTTLFTSLPSSIQAVLIFTFTLGMIIIIWKVLRA